MIFRTRVLRDDDRKNFLLASERGLFRELIQKQLLLPFEIVESADDGPFIIRSTHINSAPPSDWTLGMFVDAAICTLQTQRVATKYGFKLRDAHLQNVLFKGTKPLFVDFNSFVPSMNKIFWTASGEYRTEIKRPIYLLKNGHASMVRRLLRDPDTLPREGLWKYQYPNLFRLLRFFRVTSRIAKARERLAFLGIFNLQNALILMAVMSVKELATISMNTFKLGQVRLGIIKGTALLLAVFLNVWPQYEIKRLQFVKRRWNSDYWTRYYSSGDYSGGSARDQRFTKICSVLKELHPTSVTDIGGNNGEFLRLLTQTIHLEKYVLIDGDDASVEYARQSVLGESARSVFGVADLSSSLFHSSRTLEPYRSECACALALTHHLLLRYRMTMDQVAQYLKEFTTRYLLVEFMPLGLWNGSSSPLLPSWYNIDNFINSIEKHFDVLRVVDLMPNRTLIVAQMPEHLLAK